MALIINDYVVNHIITASFKGSLVKTTMNLRISLWRSFKIRLLVLSLKGLVFGSILKRLVFWFGFEK
jgi:hypothetical protein